MSPAPANFQPARARLLPALLPCLAVALGLRLFCFNGLSLFDDVNYWMQAIATGTDGAWPPAGNHWQTRLGFVLPCAGLLKIFGLHYWVPYAFTLLGGLGEIVLVYVIAREFVAEKTARLAAWLGVFFPLNLLFSTYLYVDLWSGVLGAAALFWWWRALRHDRARDYALASLAVGLGWLFRETVVMLAPIFLVLWIHAGQWRRPKIVFALPPALLVVAAEILLYQLTAHNWHYRFDAILASKNQMLDDLAADGSFLFTPVKMLLTSHELGVFLVGGLAVAVFAWRRVPKPLALWLVVGFGWFAWGTTTPGGWVTMQRDPRYLSVLTVPCLTLLAFGLDRLNRRWLRAGLIGLLIATGLLGAGLDVGHVKLTAHRKFLASPFNSAATALEPNVYFGARAAQDFAPGEFACASDLGRITTTRLMPHLASSRLATVDSARYAVFSVETQPDKWRKQQAAGWRVVAEFPCDAVPLREFADRLLKKFRPSATRGTKPTPGLLVLENPHFTADAPLQSH
ncbi:MAG: hypothetical protein RL380_873 [Verrucomicrobiota bacterium]